ncbi:30S ribosomal protein S16 [Candidatus Curtissbacteria bacterium RBG_13_35_7]|uniref:Small ribosomal subunit protein bS16 n=1 Tax=Candidatus Curtissbacteria bacterium RBG_13_35_7 TaxID=1797705 RepID=A0A1F5G1R9_9BACT|nr:MAG: 30S ribosomal protein S16 [Candidatus Curtissbacteria bacterium RBG_13_35_7]
MSVKIRLAKTGKKHHISYRLVAQDTKSKRDGKFLEILGYYLPYLKNTSNFKVKKDRLGYWISKGAKPTLSVSKLLATKIKL